MVQDKHIFPCIISMYVDYVCDSKNLVLLSTDETRFLPFFTPAIVVIRSRNHLDLGSRSVNL